MRQPFSPSLVPIGQWDAVGQLSLLRNQDGARGFPDGGVRFPAPHLPPPLGDFDLASSRPEITLGHLSVWPRAASHRQRS